MGKITAYLRDLKEKTGYTQSKISELCDVPEGTVAKYLAGVDDETATFSVVRKLVIGMGGDLNELAGTNSKRAIVAVNQVYHPAFDLAVKTIEESHQRAYSKLHEESINVVRDKNRWLHRMFCYCCILTVAVVVLAVMVGVVR